MRRNPTASNLLNPALALVAVLFCAACAPVRTSQSARPMPLTPAASATYDYLEYQALLQQMTRAAASARVSPEAFARTLDYQKAAAQALDRVIAKESAPSLYMDKAFLYWSPEQAGEARDILKTGLAKYPDDYNLNASLANAYLLENNIPEAAAALSSYLARHENPALRERLGQLYIDTDQAEKGLEVLRRIPSKERSTEAQFQIARGEARLGQRKAAIEYLKTEIREKPIEPPAPPKYPDKSFKYPAEQ